MEEDQREVVLGLKLDNLVRLKLQCGRCQDQVLHDADDYEMRLDQDHEVFTSSSVETDVSAHMLDQT
jgi:hypothetical protein